MVGQRERAVAVLHGAIDQLLGVRGPVEEREGGVAVQLGVGGHLSILYEHTFGQEIGWSRTTGIVRSVFVA